MKILFWAAVISSLIMIYNYSLFPQENYKSEETWVIPACAWSRPIGIHPPGATGRTKRGVPLGGIGAGNFMYNLCGSFGPWELKTGYHEEKFLPQGAFHLYEKRRGESPGIITLATEDVLSAWNRLSAGSGTYYALYPKAWFTYEGTTADVSLKQFTPVIPHNYRETSLPAAVFQFNLLNPGADTLELSLMFTFPNAGYGNDVRTGYINTVLNSAGTCGVVMKALSSENPVTTQNSEWCIAVLQKEGFHISSCPSWNAAGTGEDIYNDFSDDGILSGTALDTTNSASAVAVRIILPPGGSAVIPFALTWDFPVVKFGQGTEWFRRYTEYFGKEGGHSLNIALEALLNIDDWEREVDRWQELIINEADYPEWLKQAALNELYYDTFGGVFWENGCITKPEESSFGTLPPDDHKYFSMECIDYAYCETFDVRHYEARHYLELWPEIERDVLKWFADYIFNDPAGSAPHDAGAPARDPFFSYSGYGSNWQDMPSKFIQQVHAYYTKTGDNGFLDFVWPACLKTYNYMKTKDTNGNGLPDVGNTTYDTWGLYGDNLLCGALWIGALQAMEHMAYIKEDHSFASQLFSEYSDARMVLDTLLWQDDLLYYRIYPSSTAIMADGLNGQRYSETTGLAAVLPEQKIISHLTKVFELCVEPLQDFNGDGVGDMGAVNGRNSDGSPLGSGQPGEIWTGSSYFIAAMMYHWGKVINDEVLKDRALKTAYGVYYQTWLNEQTAYFFNTPEAWRASNPANFRAQQYQRPRSIWELLLEIKNPFDTLTYVEEKYENALPNSFKLFQNYPNPFNPVTSIEYQIPSAAFVSLVVYDLLGKELAVLVNGEREAGKHKAVFNLSSAGGRLASGIYFCRMTSGAFSETKKLILMK